MTEKKNKNKERKRESERKKLKYIGNQNPNLGSRVTEEQFIASNC